MPHCTPTEVWAQGKGQRLPERLLSPVRSWAFSCLSELPNSLLETGLRVGVGRRRGSGGGRGLAVPLTVRRQRPSPEAPVSGSAAGESDSGGDLPSEALLGLLRPADRETLLARLLLCVGISQ